MKYLYITLLSLLPFTATAVPLDRFINPIFYEELQPESRMFNNNHVKATPTSLTCFNPENKDINTCPKKCTFVDQNETRILFHCLPNEEDKKVSPELARYAVIPEFIDIMIVALGSNPGDNLCLFAFATSINEKMTLTEIPNSMAFSYLYIEKEDCGPAER